METQVSQSVPQDCPRCSKEATKVLKRETKGAQCGPQSMPWHSKVRSKESYIPQNSRSTAPAATMLVISVAVLLVLLPFGLLLLSLVLIPSPLHYYPYYYNTTGGGGGGWFVPPAPRSGAPAPEHTDYCVTITTSINILLSVLVVVLVLHVNNVSYV